MSEPIPESPATVKPEAHDAIRPETARAYCAAFVAFAIAFAAVWYGLVVFQAKTKDVQAEWVWGLYQRKLAYAASVTQPKLILVGGSATLFGTSARMIGDELKIPTVNLGTHAGLGTQYLMAKAKSVAKPGDTVLLSIEYELYDQPQFNDVTVNEVIGFDKAYYAAMSVPDRLRLVYSMPSVRLLAGLTRPFRHPVVPSGYFDPANTDVYGDEMHNTAAEAQESIVRKLFDSSNHVSPELAVGVPIRPDDSGPLVSFVRWCQANHIKVLATYPPTVEYDAYKTPAAAKAQAKYVAFYQKLGVPVLGKPSSFWYPATDFYDTFYHLVAPAEKQHTEAVIRLLKPYVSR